MLQPTDGGLRQRTVGRAIRTRATQSDSAAQMTPFGEQRRQWTQCPPGDSIPPHDPVP